ncbi:hypothetical protein [Sunxiuqinia rutila]|uniref:hypothetical protein n=1 Tax=Sunxiuqinia rutila TaxID=1397841 RepID=UPI003D36B37D
MNGCKDKKSIEDIGLLPGDCVVRKELLILGENSSGYCTNSFMRCIPVGRQTSLRNRTAAGAIAKLKEAKDLLDLGLMEEADYEKVKAELAPVIMGQ